LKVHFHDGEAIDFATPAGGGGTGADPMAFPHDWHRGLLADFLDAVETDREPPERQREPRVGGEQALKVHRFIDSLLRTR
jgi:predicted dehydrogenase